MTARTLLAASIVAALSLAGGGMILAQEAGPKPAPAAPAPSPAPVPDASDDNRAAQDIATKSLVGDEAVIGVLDKRMGTTTEFRLKPGERFAWKKISGVLRACYLSEPWQKPQTGAFVQVWETLPEGKKDKAVRRKAVFSGWLFLENPSLNPFVHPAYDVWLKSCTISRPDGPRSARSSGGTVTSGGTSN